MAYTYSFTADAAPGDEPIIVQTPCDIVTIQEKDANGTVNLLIRRPLKSNAQTLYPPGYKYTFSDGRYTKGTTIGYISVSAGAVTIQQVEGQP